MQRGVREQQVNILHVGGLVSATRVLTMTMMFYR